VSFHSKFSGCLQNSKVNMWQTALALLATQLADAGRSGELDEFYHPGHQALHVSRLHRYEQNGVAAFFEEEERWLAQEEKLHLGRRPSKASFIQVSAQQANALRLHQSNHESMLQVSEREFVGAHQHQRHISRQEGQVEDQVLRYHGLGRPDENHPAVARLKKLGEPVYLQDRRGISAATCELRASTRGVIALHLRYCWAYSWAPGETEEGLPCERPVHRSSRVGHRQHKHLDSFRPVPIWPLCLAGS